MSRSASASASLRETSTFRSTSRCTSPKSWTEDAGRRQEARIPDDVAFKTKLDLARIELITTAVEDKIPGKESCLPIAFTASRQTFGMSSRIYGFDFGVAVNAVTGVWLLDAIGRRRGRNQHVGAQQLGVDLGQKAFRRAITWREGTKGSRKKLSSRFCFRRVKVANDDGTEARDKEAAMARH